MANPILNLYTQKKAAEADNRTDVVEDLEAVDAVRPNPVIDLYARKKAQKKREVEAKPKVPEELTAPWRAYTAEDTPDAMEELTVPKVLRPGAVKKYRFQQGAGTAGADGMARMRGDSPEYAGMLADGMSWEEADRALVRQIADPSRNVLAEERKARSDGDVVLPSGTILRREDMKGPNADIGTFFRQVVEPGIEAAEGAAEKRYAGRVAGQAGQGGCTWRESIKAALQAAPLGGEASAAQLSRLAGESRRERGPARIVQDVLAGVSPDRANAYIADHLKDDPEFAAAAKKFGQVIPTQNGPGPSDEELQQAVASMTPAQQKQYDKRVAEEQQRITTEQEALGRVAREAWTREAEKFRQGITGQLVEEMARRNMPKNELEAFARTAYNASIPGLLMEWAAGNIAGDENKALYAQIMQRAMEKYDPTLATKIGGEVTGLLLSGPMFSAGGAAGKVGAAGIRKLAERNVMKRLMTRGITEGTEGVARRLVAGSTANQLAQAAVASGTTLGSYDAVATPLAMAATGEDASATDVLGATGRGFATGMLLPGIGMAAGRVADAATSRLGRYAAELGGFAAENAAFVGMGTLYNGLRTGEWGTPEQLAEEFGHSVGVLGIMKSIGALKRGRTKNPGFYDKVLAETEFTPEEVAALDRAGVDGHSYKRAVFDLLNAKETVGGREVAERAAEQLGSRYAEVMQSVEVPISAKAKLMYLIEGRIPVRAPLTTDMQRTVSEDGRTTVDLMDPTGNLVQRRTFATEQAADAFERESAPIRKINTIQYYENRLEEQRSRTALDDAAQAYAAERGMGVEAVRAEVLKAAQGQPHDTETVRQVVEHARPLREQYDDVPAMMAEGIALKYGLGESGFDRALSLKELARTPNQRAAVAEYAARLKEFVTQERQTEAETPRKQAERQLMQVAEQEIVQTRNRDDDVIYTATMQNGKTANIIKGAGLVYDPETGEIDTAKSDATVVVRYEDGTMRQVSVRDIDMIVEAMNADDIRIEAQRTIQEQLNAATRDEAVAKAADGGGMVVLKDGRVVAIEGMNEDGTLQIAVQNETGQIISEQITAEEVVGPATEDADVSGTADSMLDRSLTSDEAVQVVAQMQAAAVPAPQIELTPENWAAEFGADGLVATPIGEVKMGENQYLKLLKNRREQYFGMIAPTLNTPDIVLEEIDSKEGAEQDSKYLFLKTFVRPDGGRYVHFESVTVQKDNLEVSISSHEIDKKALMKKMHNDRIMHLDKSLLGSEGRLTKPLSEGPDLVPTPNDSENKDTTTIPETQEVKAEIPLQKNGKIDWNAMPSEMLAVELSSLIGQEKAVERLQGSRNANAKNIKKLQKSIAEMGDLNKAVEAEQRLLGMQAEDSRLSEALDMLGIVDDSAAAEIGKTFSAEIAQLFPKELPNVRARILADIARGQRFVWNDSPDGVKRGMATELGFSGNEGERRARFGILGTEGTGARHISRYVHDLWQDSNGYAFDMDDAALRDEVIDVLLTTPSRASAMKQLRDIADRNAEDRTLPRDAEDQAAMRAYEAQQDVLRESRKNATFAEKTPASDERAEKPERDNDVRRKADSGGVSSIGARTVPSDGSRSAGQEYKPGVDAFGNSVSGRGTLYDATAVRMVHDGQANEATVQIRRDDDGGRTANHRGLSGRNRNESGRDNDARRKADNRRLFGNPTGVELAASDRSDIRLFEEGLGTSHYEHSEYSEGDRREAESQRLVVVAKEAGRYIDPKKWNEFGRKHGKRTGESVVYIDEAAGKVYKIKNPYAKAAIRGGVPEEAIYDHVIHNLLFPETRYALEGISDHLGGVRIVLSQDFVESAGQPTQQQIDSALAGRGLFPEDKYTYGNSLVSVTDVEGDNALLGRDGTVYFIDPIIKLKKPAREVLDALEMNSTGRIDDVPFSVVNAAEEAPAGVTPERWGVIVDQLRRVIGDGNVVTDPVAVRAAYDQIMQRGAEVRRNQVEQATERFNTQLKLFMDGKLPSGEKIGLGAPGATLLACGISDADITITQRVLKDHIDNHELTADDIKNLPAALENPVMVYEWGAKANATVVITEIARGDQQIAVALKLKPGRNGAVVNAVASVHGKSVERLLADMNTPLTDFGADNLKWVDKEKVLDWITAGSSGGSSGSDQGLVTATNIVTNFENPKIGPENVRRSIKLDKTLVGVHNLTEDNVLHAVRMGGLANPSLAVIDMNKGGEFDNFGDITLIAPRSLIDKSSGKNIGTYGADVYTPRYPYIEREYGAKFQQFARKVDGFVASHFDAENPIAKRYLRAKPYMQPQNASDAERAIKSEPFMQAYYAKEILKKKIPQNITTAQIGELIPDMSAYFQWINDTMSGLAEREVIPNEYTPSGHKRYLNHTLENVSRFMKAQGRAGNEGYNYGLGTLRSYFTPKFASLSQIRNAKSRLQAPDEFRQTKQTFQDEYEALLQQLSSTNIKRDLVKDVDSHLASAMLSNNMQGELEPFGYKPSDELLSRIAEFREALRRMPSEYFETKFERPVYLKEFAGAVVPEDVDPSTIKALRESGISTVTTYDPTQIGAREAALRSISAEIDPQSNVYFMHTPQGEVYGFTTEGRIYMDSSQMNAETPMHEYSELWSQIVAREQPELWARGVELMKQTATWNQVNADPNYKHLSEGLRVSETLSRIVAADFAREQSKITDDRKLLGKLRKWLREFWGSLKATFSRWTKKDTDNLTGRQFAKMPLRDFVEGVDLSKYNASNSSVAGFSRAFTERRVTTLEKLENKRAALIADRENIANFDEQLSAADAEIAAYMESDPVAETLGKDGEYAQSEAHLRAVEDVVYDIVRKDGVEGVQVDVVRSPDAMLEYARNKNWTDHDVEDIVSDQFSPGYYGDYEITILASLVKNKKDAERKFWHERTHGATDEVCRSEQLITAAKQAGTELLDRALAEREYTSDRWSLERQADEYVARAVEIIAGKGLLTDYLAAPEAEITPTTDYLTERNVPQGLAEIILKDCEFIKKQKYGIDTRVRYDSYHRTGDDQNRLAVDERAGRTTGEASKAGSGTEQSGRTGASGIPGAEVDGGTDGDNRILFRGEQSITRNVSEREFKENMYVGDFDRSQTEGGADTIFADRTSMPSNERIADTRYAETGSDRHRFAGNSYADGDTGGVRRNGEVGFQQHLDSSPKLTRQQQLIADLRRAVRESKASTRAVAQIVSRRVREEVGRELAEVMGKRDFDAIVRQIEQATVRNEVERPLRRIAEIVCDLEIKRTQATIDKLLQQKVQGEGTRGVAVAKVVDDRTRQAFELFRNNIGRPAEEVMAELEEGDSADMLAHTDALNLLDVYNDTLRYRREIADVDSEKKGVYLQNTEKRKQRIESNKAGDTERFETLKSEIILNNDILEALDQEQMQTKEHLLAALREVDRALNGLIGEGREMYADWLKERDDRRKGIIKMAFRDVGVGKSIPVLDRQPGVWERGYRRTMDFLLSPAYSMDYLLKMISVNAPKGEGAMYDQFMRSEYGYVEARGRYYLGYEDFKRVLDEKAQTMFGKSYPEVIADSNAPTIATITITNGKAKEQYAPTIGEALYIYMADKMEDGCVKLRRMGISEMDIRMLADALPSQYVHFADWLQNEFLPKRRKVYNEIHLDVFGIQMAQIEHYVPLRVQKSNIRQEVNGAESDPDTLPSAITGSIIKRIRNKQILNLHTNALDLMLEHGQQMEHWSAFTRVVQDMNALLSNTEFRRMLNTRNPGLHKRLKIAAQLAADTYHPQVNDVNRAWIALGKLAASSKIAFRVNTALKQVLSYPAFYAYLFDPKFWGLLTKNLAPTTWSRNWRWAIDNIPSFHERWLGRMAGNEKLAQMTAPALDKWLDKMNKYGMVPNAFVDALTCANGAKAVYDFRKGWYMERGRTEIEAERLARIDAAIAINLTQQSGEGMYLGQIQADRDFWSVSLSTFQNSNFAYLRKQLEGIDELRRDTDQQRHSRAKYYKERGFTEEESFDMALKDVIAAKRGALLNIGVFMFGLNLLWGLGNSVWKYLFAPDTRDEIPAELTKSALVTPIRNTTIGSIAESAIDGYGANPSVLLSDMVGFYNKVSRIMQKENPDAWNETAAYIAMQTLTANGLGIDLESFVNMYQGIAGMIRDGADVEDVMRILNAPQSQAKLIAGKPKEGETEEQYRERMIFTERRITSRLNDKRRDKWSRNYAAYRQAEALNMTAERDKFGSVKVPDLNQVDEEYMEALKRSGLTVSGNNRKDFDWQAQTTLRQEEWRARARRVQEILELERQLDTVVVFNERYVERMRELLKAKREYTNEINKNY